MEYDFRIQIVGTEWTDGTKLGIGWYVAQWLDNTYDDLDPRVNVNEGFARYRGSEPALAFNTNEIGSDVRFIDPDKLPRIFPATWWHTNRDGKFSGVRLFQFHADQPVTCAA